MENKQEKVDVTKQLEAEREKASSTVKKILQNRPKPKQTMVLEQKLKLMSELQKGKKVLSREKLTKYIQNQYDLVNVLKFNSEQIIGAINNLEQSVKMLDVLFTNTDERIEALELKAFGESKSPYRQEEGEKNEDTPSKTD